MGDFGIFIMGIVIGLVVGAGVFGMHADWRAANRGFLEHNGALYLVLPAKPVATP
jgi:hypothetical protein